MQKSIYLFLVLMGLGCTSPDEKPEPTPTPTVDPIIMGLLDSAGNKLINQPLINSTSIAVHYKGQDFVGHYGELEKGKGNAPSDQTIYEVGSLSKVFTGTLAAKAVLDGKLCIEEKITNYLSEPYPNLAYKDQPILLKHLLTHSSGFPNVLPLELIPLATSEFLDPETPAKMGAILEHYNKAKFLEDLHTITIDTTPGIDYSYSSAGTEMVAHLLETTYQTDFEQLLKSFLQKEVGMMQTKIVLDDIEQKNLAVGYHAHHPTITTAMKKLPWGAGGNVKSTTPDMLKFIQYHLDNQAIAKESHQVLVPFTETIGLAYFWRVDASDEQLGTYYFHHGGVPRAQCFVFVVPKYDLGIFLITNQSGKETAKKLKMTVDAIIQGIIKQEESSSAPTEKEAH